LKLNKVIGTCTQEETCGLATTWIGRPHLAVIGISYNSSCSRDSTSLLKRPLNRKGNLFTSIFKGRSPRLLHFKF